MKLRFFRVVATIATICLLAAAPVAFAQNLLVNGDLESTLADVYFDGFDPTLADDVPGWNLFLGAADGSYVLVGGVGSGNVDLDSGNGPAGGGIETAVGSRPVVSPGAFYTARVTSDDYFGDSGASYFIDWFDGGGSLLSSIGGDVGDPNGPFVFEPYAQLFGVTGAAPGGAATAGVRFTSGNANYNGLTADNFSLTAVPEPTSLALMMLASIALAVTQRHQRSKE